jgi:hypothetical protein
MKLKLLLASLTVLLILYACSQNGGGNPTNSGQHQIPKYSLSVTVTPAAGGQVTVSPNSAAYDSATAVTLSARPSSNYRFSQWTGDGTGTDTLLQIIMGANKSVTAQFVPVSITDTNVVFMYNQMSAGDTIDSTGTYRDSSGAIYWTMLDSLGRQSIVPAVITVSHDTASVTGTVVPGMPLPLTIVGVLAYGPGGAFAGSVWKVTSVSTTANGAPISVSPAPGTAMFLYFKSAGGKVFVLDHNQASSKLMTAIILACPLAFASIATSQGFVVDTAKSDCDTLWGKIPNPLGSGTIDGFILGNKDSLTLDLYLKFGFPPVWTKYYSYPLY